MTYRFFAKKCRDIDTPATSTANNWMRPLIV